MSRHAAVARQSQWGALIDGEVRHVYESILGEPIPRRLAEMASILAIVATRNRELVEAIRASSCAQPKGHDGRDR